jgi:hypothetical protein
MDSAHCRNVRRSLAERALPVFCLTFLLLWLAGCSSSQIGADTVAPAALSVGPASLVFRTLLPDETAAEQSVHIANSGSTADVLHVRVEGVDAQQFPFTSDCPAQLAPGAQCQVQLRFVASGGGTRSATLTVGFNSGAESHVALSASTDPAGRQIAQLQAHLRTKLPVSPYFEVMTTLLRDIEAATEVIEVRDASAYPQNERFIAELRQGSKREYVLVIGHITNESWSVIRGYAGTTPTTFSADATSIAWLPVIHRRSAAINGEPLGQEVAQFATSVGGEGAGQLVNALPNGIRRMIFPNGEEREVTVRNGIDASWLPALGAGTMLTAEASPTRHPAGVANSDPLQLFAARFDRAAPVHITQAERLQHPGAILTTALPASGETSFGVDSTADFPQNGEFVVQIAREDLRVRVVDATTLAIVERGANGTQPVQIYDATTNLYQVLDVDLRNGGTQAFLVTGGLNSGLRYAGVAPAVAPLIEYKPKQPLNLHFEFDGDSFEILASGNMAVLLLIDDVIQHTPDHLVEPSYSGRYWHRFDFGSRKPRRISLLMAAYPMAIAHAPGDTVRPWDRSAEPVVSYDGDSFGETEGYLWRSAPNGGGLGFFLETMLELGITQMDYGAPVGGTGYSQEGPAVLPTYPRRKYSGVNRVSSIAAGPAPLLFIGALGHNDNQIDSARFAADALTYWTALRRAWPHTILVATQFYFPAAGPREPEAFLANPLSTARDPLILQALTSAGGPWIFVNSNNGSWMNSRGASGTFGAPGQPLITGTGFGGASGYRGGRSTGVGNGDLMIRDDGVHTSNLGARHLGTQLAAAIRAGALGL